MADLHMRSHGSVRWGDSATLIAKVPAQPGQPIKVQGPQLIHVSSDFPHLFAFLFSCNVMSAERGDLIYPEVQVLLGVGSTVSPVLAVDPGYWNPYDPNGQQTIALNLSGNVLPAQTVEASCSLIVNPQVAGPRDIAIRFWAICAAWAGPLEGEFHG